MSDARSNSTPGPRPWRRGTAGPAQRPARTPAPAWSLSARQRLLFFLGAGLCAVGGVIVAWLLLARDFEEPFFLTIAITEYEDPGLPPNAWATRDSDFLHSHFSPQKSRKIFHCQEGHELLGQLETVRAADAPALVVHLRAHARHQNGQVFLLPGNADLNRPTTWVNVQDVLKAVGKGNGPRLLLLDVMQPLAVPVLGLLADDVATPLDAALRVELQKTDHTLFVLCACRAGQTSQVSENLGLSVFAYYLHEGLRGAADGENPAQKKDGRVSVKELAQFVIPRVERWAALAHGVAQKPILYGDGPDFDLVAPIQRRPEAARPRQDLVYPPWLRTGWDERDQWWNAGHYHSLPLLVRRLDAALLRAEQNWRAGVEETLVEHKLRKDLDYLRGQLPPPVAASSPPRSLAAAEKAGQQPDAKLHKPLDDLLGDLEKAVKPEEKEKLKPEIDKFLKLTKGRPFELGHSVLQAAREMPRVARLAALNEVLQERSLDRFAEVRRLRQLTAFCKELPKRPDAERLPPGTLRNALDAIAGVEEAVLIDPRSLPWLRKRLDELTVGRKEGIGMLVHGPAADWPQALERLQQVSKRCTEAARADKALREALDLRDLALAALPAVLPYYLARADGETRRLEQTWRETVQAVEDLDQELTRLLAAPDPATTTAVAERREQLQSKGVEVWFRFKEEGIDQLLQRARRNGDVAAYREMDAVLASAWSWGFAREKLWSASRALAGKLQEKIDGLDRDPTSFTRAGEAKVGPAPTELDRAEQRARLAVGLLRLIEPQQSASLQQDVEAAAAARDLTRWQNLGQRLRDTWRKEVPARYQEQPTGAVAADRLSRLVPVVKGQLLSSPADPSAAQWRRAVETYQRWLEKHFAG